MNNANQIIKGLEIEQVTLMINVTKPIEVGGIKATLHAQIEADRYPLEDDVHNCDFTDITDISYMGMEISNWEKFIKGHKEMGIDIDKIMNDKYDEEFTEEKIKAIIEQCRK